MIQVNEETKKEKMERAMGVMLEAIKDLKPGDNIAINCPICNGELIIYKPFKKKIAAKCKTDSCIRVVN
ncbi:MAG TPA: hypothetical protein PLZ08_11435 [Bacillota bacterium]|nr:hypothetical protein [Bacillota bacterium]HOL09769.1 hypothetical protein [Bacillota bacterium]HPO98551.1 hypothetical protein [Bacillota bacterium]